ncbi:type VI secretion system membrane subunit TssM [Rhodovarius crocodyli]|uniref:Type VI secretion system membrane subunit TssM n=1 Tax=Rhodovarius crocodyli TaxID=1979269 RepID=A0A437MMC6_9PROT|nr:type VI secretion system membrane subunit TssM [Rhodovarius crocodyli]RVT98814.1 type VI secretion system membrane subunit TssM [Rhodovarius crocodyli]
MRAFVTIPALASLVAVILIGVLLWLFLPLLGEAFDAIWLRAVIIAVPVVLWVLIFFLIGRRREKRDDALVEAVATAEPNRKEEASAEEEAQLRQRLTEALGKLKNVAGKKGSYLYDQPWYVIIGPPGSGKTTALANSGLEFPLTEHKLSGVGGTRFCDWWLTERAVLIDTAGRYTTQDSDAEADKAGWERFLDLLRNNRPRQPLNGILVAFGMDMLSRLGEAERQEHARTIRRRIKELETKLGQRLPVYFLVTKADLLPGFTEYFEDLDKNQREQVWGFTFPMTNTPEGPVMGFEAEFTALIERLIARMPDRLQTERGPTQRAALAGFPGQFASVQESLNAFAKLAFGGSRMEPAPMLRGVYFTSGTQEGNPLDRLAGAMSRGFGVEARTATRVVAQKGRAYFIGGLLKNVIFNEARLAATDRGRERQWLMLRLACWLVALLVLLGGGAWGWTALNAEKQRAERLAAAVGQAEQASRATPLDRVQTPDLAGVLAYLETTRALPPAVGEDSGALGFNQQEILHAGADDAYRRALDRVLLPRLLARLEVQIREGLQRPDFLYEAVRVYLMLGRQGPMDKALVREWFVLDWQSAFPGAVNQPGRDALARHLDAMLEGSLPSYPLDGALVDSARRIFSRLPQAQRSWARLRAMPNSAPGWNPAQALGPAGQRYFVRPSGRAMTEGVPGLYTIEGLYSGVLANLPQAVREAASEAWVLGPEALVAQAADPRQLERDILGLYAQEYIRAWEAVLTDLVLPPFPNLNAAAEGLNLLGAPNSPMKELLRSVARQLSVGTAPEGTAAAAAQGAAGAAAAAAQGAAGRLQQALGVTAANPAATVAQRVETHFQAIRDAAGQPMDVILPILNDLYVQVARLANAPPGTVLPPAAGLDPGQRLLAEAQRQPQPLQGWLQAMAQSVNRVRAGGAAAAIAAAGGAAMGPLCRGLETRFPFRRTRTATDMPSDDFVRLFAPGGVMDSFFAQHVRPYADTTQRPWRPVATDGLPPPISQNDLIQFQRAQAIRDAFFPSGTASGFRFQLIPQGLGVGATAATLESMGVRNALTPGGGGRPIEMIFPALHPVTLTFDPASSAGDLAYDGAWSTLKLVFLGRLVATPAPDRFRLTIIQGDRVAEFTVQASSSQNPFALRELNEFRCPTLQPPSP